jgi:hypothetical protein
MTRKEISNKIDAIMTDAYRDGVSLYKLGVSEFNAPIVSRVGQIVVKVAELRRYGRVYLSVDSGNKNIGGGWATHDDLPIEVLKTILAILKNADKDKNKNF